MFRAVTNTSNIYTLATILIRNFLHLDAVDNYCRFIQLIRRRHLLFSESNSEQLPAFDYNKLQNDVIEEFILGKPLIEGDVNYIRIPFKFRKPMAVAVGIGISKADVDSLSSSLGDKFKVPVDSCCTLIIIIMCSFSVN